MSRRGKKSKRGKPAIILPEEAKEIWAVAGNPLDHEGDWSLKRDGQEIRTYAEMQEWIAAEPHNASTAIRRQLQSALMTRGEAAARSAERVAQLTDRKTAVRDLLSWKLLTDWAGHTIEGLNVGGMPDDVRKAHQYLQAKGYLTVHPMTGLSTITDEGLVARETSARHDLRLQDTMRNWIEQAAQGNGSLKMEDLGEGMITGMEDLLAAGWVELDETKRTVKMTPLGEARLPKLLEALSPKARATLKAHEEEATWTADYNFSRDGVLALPVATIRLFSKLAQEEGLPGALTEVEINRLHPAGRHLVTTAEQAQTDDGHYYVKVVLEALLREDLAKEGTKESRINAAFPLAQYGLLVESGQGEGRTDHASLGMPIHAGARSFEPIFLRQRELARTAQQMGTSLDRGNGWTDDAEVPFWQSTHLSRVCAANSVLDAMLGARVITVAMDVSEGLPDWESRDETWDYAKDAQLPYPVTFFDFSTPGGFTPRIISRTHEGLDVELSLRAAMCWRDSESDDALSIAPFTWMTGFDHDDDDDPEWSPRPGPLERQSDFDPIGVVSFNGKVEAPITHVRTPGPGPLSGSAAIVSNDILCGMPGWTHLNVDMVSAQHVDHDELVKARAWIGMTAASRVLSVIYALDSTVNIELVEDSHAPRPERRAVKRAQEKGREDVHIAETVQIRPTRFTNRDRSETTPTGRQHTHAHWRRGHFAHYPLGTRIADAWAESAPNKLVDHPVKGPCRKVYRTPTIVGRTGSDGEERTPIAKSYVWKK